MRSDMSKVIVERPRLRFPLKNGSAYPRGRMKNRFASDLEDAPLTEAMGGVYREKRLNENLQPLVRFLRSRVGKHWNTVHSEISERLSVTSAVQKHVLDHLKDYVHLHVKVAGRVVLFLEYGGWRKLESHGMHLRFYVHPKSHCLELAPLRARKKKNHVTRE